VTVSTLHGLLVYWTRSVLPSLVLHACADFLVLPVQYGIVGHATVTPVTLARPDAALLVCIAMIVGGAIAAVPAFRRLASCARVEASLG
jgi:hypothetical protein